MTELVQSFKIGDYVRYKSGNVLVVVNERDSGSYDVKSLIIGKNTNSVIRSLEDLVKVTKISISICPECLKFVDKLHHDIVKCDTCSSYLHKSHLKKHECLDSYPIPTLSKLHELLNEIGLALTDISSLEAPSLSAGADTLHTSEIENIKGSKMINLDQIIDGEQLRFELSRSHIEYLKREFMVNGQEVPVKVYEHENMYKLDDGHHRVIAARELNWSKINAIIINSHGSDFDRMLSSYRSNVAHLAFSKIEKAIALKKLYDAKRIEIPELSIRQFAEEIVQEPSSTVYDSITLASLHPRIHAMIEDEENPLSKKTAYKLKVMSLEEQERFLNKFENALPIYQLRLWVDYWDRFSEKEKEKVLSGADIGPLHTKYNLIAMEEKYDSICDKLETAFDVKIEYEIENNATEYQIRTSIISSLKSQLEIELFNGTSELIDNFKRSTNKSVSKFIKLLKTEFEINKGNLEEMKKVRKQLDYNVSMLEKLNDEFDPCEFSKEWCLFEYANRILLFNFKQDETYEEISDAEVIEKCNWLNLELSRQIKHFELKSKLIEKVNQIEISQDQGEYGDRRDAILKLINELPEFNEADILQKIEDLEKDLLFIKLFVRGTNLRTRARSHLTITHKPLVDQVEAIFSPDEFNKASIPLEGLIAFGKQLTELEERIDFTIALVQSTYEIMQSKLSSLPAGEIKTHLIEYFAHEELPHLGDYISDIIGDQDKDESTPTNLSSSSYIWEDKQRKTYSQLFTDSLDFINSIQDKINNNERTTSKEQNLFSLLSKSIKLWEPHQKNGIQYKDADIEILKEIYDLQKAAFGIYNTISDPKDDFDGSHVIMGIKCDKCPTENYKCENTKPHNSDKCTGHNCRFDFLHKHDNCTLDCAHHKSECIEQSQNVPFDFPSDNAPAHELRFTHIKFNYETLLIECHFMLGASIPGIWVVDPLDRVESDLVESTKRSSAISGYNRPKGLLVEYEYHKIWQNEMEETNKKFWKFMNKDIVLSKIEEFKPSLIESWGEVILVDDSSVILETITNSIRIYQIDPDTFSNVFSENRKFIILKEYQIKEEI